MKIYVCGGAVRDVLLNNNPKDLDYVVVGSTIEEMIALGYQNVGASFPVFLHPETKEEYALARTEHSTGNGYHDFEVDFNPNVTLKDDVFRRDLTINSLCVSIEDWNDFLITKDRKYVIDYFNGINDLDNQILRHVSEHFADDPVRILRICRFAARYISFQIHPETLSFMKDMVTKGMVNHLTSERVWLEFEKALKEQHSSRFIEMLNLCGALNVICPSFNKTPNTLDDEFCSTYSLPIKFALWLRFLSHPNVIEICSILKTPTEFSQAAIIVNEFYSRLYAHEDVFNVDWTIQFLNSHNCFRDSSRVDPLLFVLQHDCDHIMVIKQKKRKIAKEWLNGVIIVFSKINFNSIPLEERKDLSGKAIGLRLNEMRVNEIEILRNSLLED